ALAWTAALNLARNRLRWRKLRGWPAAPDTLEGVAGTEDPEAEAEQANLHAALRRLPVRMLQVVLMAEFSGMAAREIGEVLGIPEGTVASRRHQAVKRLKQWLGEHCWTSTCPPAHWRGSRPRPEASSGCARRSWRRRHRTGVGPCRLQPRWAAFACW